MASQLTRDQINTSFPWTERLWKQLEQSPDLLNSGLFFGKKGLGKSHVAVRYALKLLENEDVLLSGNHPDLHVIIPEEEAEVLNDQSSEESNTSVNNGYERFFLPDRLLSIYGVRYLEKNTAKAKKIITVQQIRLLIEQIMQHPNLSEHKLVVIKSADKMNVNAANALLKTLEEPPKNTSFVLLADHIERLPITIRSRCSEFHFRSPDIEIGLQWLQQQNLEQHSKSYLMMAGRAPLLALSMSTNNEIENLRTMFSTINALWARKKSSLELSNEWKKYDFSMIFMHLNQFLHDLLKIKLLLKESNNEIDSQTTELFYPVQQQWSMKIANSVTADGLIRTIDEVQTIQKLGETPTDKQLLLENVAIQLEKLALNHA